MSSILLSIFLVAIPQPNFSECIKGSEAIYKIAKLDPDFHFSSTYDTYLVASIVCRYTKSKTCVDGVKTTVGILYGYDDLGKIFLDDQKKMEALTQDICN